tara:strand:+ start:1434 stop:1574 length:141 start_codon:yes stop_codon:yes gene_type:complete
MTASSQTAITEDLHEARDAGGSQIIDEAENVIGAASEQYSGLPFEY